MFFEQYYVEFDLYAFVQGLFVVGWVFVGLGDKEVLDFLEDEEAVFFDGGGVEYN